MKKKILSILLCGVLLISLTGCGSKESSNDKETSTKSKSYVTYENGESYTFEELQKIAKENSLAFKEKYCEVPATITAELTKITDYKTTRADGLSLLEIWLEGTDSWSNYVAKIDYNKYKDLLLEVKVGDYLTLTNLNIHCTFYTDFSRIEVQNPNVAIAK